MSDEITAKQIEEASTLNRRGFLKGAAFGAMGAMSVGLFAGCAPQAKADQDLADTGSKAEPEAAATSAPATATATTPEELSKFGGSSMTRFDLRKRRQELVDAAGDVTLSDGTVVPAVWNKVLTIVDLIGYGNGNAKYDNAFTYFQYMFEDEKEAELYVSMPLGETFEPWQWAREAGLDEAECVQACEKLANKGMLFRSRQGGQAYYTQVPLAHGMIEYNLDRYWEEGFLSTFFEAKAQQGPNDAGLLHDGAPFYYAIPCDTSVVADEKVLIGQDWHDIINRHESIGVSPCQCRLTKMAMTGEPEAPKVGTEELKDFMTPGCGHPLETCLSFGEEAEYYISRNLARPVTKEEATKILQRSVDAGMVVHCCYSKSTEIICSCHSDCCGVLGTYVALGPDAIGTSENWFNVSNYDLNYDKDVCIGCGQCVQRCTMTAIAMGEDGHPETNALCIRCGQCGMVCPMGARTLVERDDALDRYKAMPLSMHDGYNMQTAWRLEHGLVSDPASKTEPVPDYNLAASVMED